MSHTQKNLNLLLDELNHRQAMQEKEISELRADVKTLLAMAERSKGSLWAGMIIVWEVAANKTIRFQKND